MPHGSRGFVVFKKGGPLTIKSLHERVVSWFVGRPGFGITRMKVINEIVFDSLPLPDEKIDLGGQGFGVTEIHLIGVAKHEPPVAFLLEDRSATSPHRPAKGESARPRMENLEPYKTRPLSENEEKAVTAMQSDTSQDIVTFGPNFNITTPTVEVVGAVRATTSCLECHRVNEGDLLGAFI